MDGYYFVNSSDDPCSHDFDCMLSFKTRSRIGSTIDDNGNSFSDCQSRCALAFDNTPRSRTITTKTTKTPKRPKTRQAPRRSRRDVNAGKCDCYCAMFHDPCPEAPPATAGMYIINNPLLSSMLTFC